MNKIPEQCVKLDADEAIKRKGVFAVSDGDLLKKIQDEQNDKFTDIRSLRFGWVKQPSSDGKKTELKLMTTLPNGKYVFPDKTQNVEEIIPEDSYLCLVFEPTGQKVAFAKILFPEYQPKIYVPPTRIPAMVWRDNKGTIHRKLGVGNSYQERMMYCMMEMEKLGVDSYKVIHRKK